MTTAAAHEQQPIRLLFIAGSLREASTNRRLARLAARLAPATVEIVEYDDLASVEPYDQDIETATGFAPGAARLAEAVRAADGVFIATPEYNGSIPGQLKNALDWLSRPDGARPDQTGLQASPLFGMPVAIASASSGQFGAVWARDELVKVVKTQGGRAIAEPSVTIPSVASAFDDDGQLRSSDQRAALDQLVASLASTAATVRSARARARMAESSSPATA
ncbi:MAG: NAD(P)H-dependent oxidoreductase [Thermoleophilia bacterium]|nr:NAD(P)H-dependent oxidoreductase [Thermoleophilia bacterium]